MTLSLKEALTKSLIERGLLTEEKLKEAVQLQEQRGGHLKDILVELGIVSKEDVVSIIGQELSIPPINLSRFKVDPAILKLIPRKHAKRYHIIPISKIEDVLTVAMEDPLNIFALDHIRAITRFKITPVLASAKDIQDAISEYYEESAYEEIEEVVRDISAPTVNVEIMEGKNEIALDTTEIMKATKEAPVVKLANQFLNEAVRLRASDILVEPFETGTRIRYRIDGILRQVQTFPRYFHHSVVSRFKVMSSLNIAEQRLPQDGRFKLRISGKEVDFRISVLPSAVGEKVALRILDKSTATLDLAKLGFNKKTMDDLTATVTRPHGMILVCGPTGSGKTTTLYSLLRLVSTSKENIVTVEDPIEYQLEGLNQVAARPEMGLTFAATLRSILRQDPDIIMVGEIRDYETADIAIKSALTGHRLFTTLHTTTATGALVRLINMGVEPFLISSSVVLTAAQRLVRRICTDCKVSYELAESLKPRLGVKKKGTVTLFRGRGCKFCSQTGYRGRMALMETLVITPLMRRLIAEKADEHRIRKEAREQGMITLREDGLEKAMAGLITVEEVLRVTAGEQGLEIKSS